MKKIINNLDFGAIIEQKRIERGLTYEQLGEELGYTKSGIRQLILSNNVKCHQIELFSLIMKFDFFAEFSNKLKGVSAETKYKVKDFANKVKIEEYQEKYITCLEDRANITTKLQEATLYINRCEILLLKNDIPLPVR